MSSRTRNPRGVTLIEVLMSIGVVLIGLLGVAALFPIAGHQAREGARNDRVANIGKRAFREIKVRGVLDPDRWRYFDLATNSWKRGAPFYEWVPDVRNQLAPPIGLRLPTALVLDPWGLTNQAMNSAEINARQIVFQKFNQGARAASLGKAAKVYRISIDVKPDMPLSAAEIAAHQLLVDEWTFLQDDLEFDVPDSNNRAPNQEVLREVDSSGQLRAVKRAARGQFSWIVTMVPADMRPMDPSTTERYRGPYKVSVAVFQERTKFEPVIEMKVNEFDGWGGGTAIIEACYVAPGGTTPVPIPSTLKRGQWVLLAGISLQEHLPEAQRYAATDYRWYRVTSVDPTSRSMVLSGGDWPYTAPSPRASGNFNQGGGLGSGQHKDSVFVLYFGNIVGVYSKTMYLD
jgi:hypothetical protein